MALAGFHVLGHIPQLLGGSLHAARAESDRAGGSSGAAGRLLAVGGALVGGAVLAVALIPEFGVWTAHGALHHHGR